MQGMAGWDDKYFDLAIVDVPYGGGQNFNFRYGIGDQVYDSRKPDADYWLELFRVSVNQIVWGANYLTDFLPVGRCWISWYKGQPIDAFSDFELAWTSFDKTCRAVKLESYGFNHADKKQTGNGTIHPTQKPVALYKWLLKNYAKEGDKILDTHLGSGSSRIAAFDMGFDLTGYELDKDYFDAAEKRFQNHKAQLKLFQP
jgi:site-specific DNA-methyltransferase (adenine-specific)